jgi:hypothetical protein
MYPSCPRRSARSDRKEASSSTYKILRTCLKTCVCVGGEAHHPDPSTSTPNITTLGNPQNLGLRGLYKVLPRRICASLQKPRHLLTSGRRRGRVCHRCFPSAISDRL